MSKVLLIMVLIISVNHSALALKTDSTDINEDKSALHQVLNKFKSSPVLRSHFKQQRKLNILKKPLLSEGKFSFISGRGIIWEIKKPYPSVIIISEESVIEITRHNNTENINKKVNTGGFYNVLESLLSGKIGQIESNFETRFSGSSKKWEIKLTPKTAPLNKIFTVINLRGNEVLNHIQLTDKNSDTTAIDLVNIIKTPEKITALEESYFAL